MRGRARTFGIAALAWVAAATSAAAAGDGSARVPPLPEPLIAESITNIEGTEPGEIEFDAEAVLLSRGSAGTAGGFGVEAEWRATGRLGLSAEASVARAGSGEPTLGQLQTGLAWSLFHDAARDFHVQAEATGRFGPGEDERAEASIELPHPFSVGARAALRTGELTWRSGLGASLGDGASLFVHLAALHTYGGPPARGFAGVEVNANVGAGPPLTFVPEIFVTVPIAGVPVDVGLGIPWAPGLRSGVPASVGGVLRLVVEP